MAGLPTNPDTAHCTREADGKGREVCRFVIDAEGQTLGRLASLVAKYIRGKHTPLYTPSMDVGAAIVVVNCEKVTVTGRKADQKLYKRHTNGLPGSMKVETFKQLQSRIPERIIEKAVWGMLPKGRIGRKIKHNLFVRSCMLGPNDRTVSELDRVL